MKFWDSSALVPLIVTQPPSRRLQTVASGDPEMFVWWAAEVECASALARLRREEAITSDGAAFGFAKLKLIADKWDEIEPSETLRETAIRFLRVHALRAADALQLGAAFIASERRATSLEFVSLDGRLLEAARKEGFSLVDVRTD